LSSYNETITSGSFSHAASLNEAGPSGKGQLVLGIMTVAGRDRKKRLLRATGQPVNANDNPMITRDVHR
jgi:hypothetical protein